VQRGVPGDWTGGAGVGASWPLWFLGAAHALPSWGCTALGLPSAGLRTTEEGQEQGRRLSSGEREREWEWKGRGKRKGGWYRDHVAWLPRHCSRYM